MKKFNEWLENNSDLGSFATDSNYTITGPMGNSPTMRKNFERAISDANATSQFLKDIDGKYSSIRFLMDEETIRKVKEHMHSRLDMISSFQAAQHAPQA
jgi:hypothetical protein